MSNPPGPRRSIDLSAYHCPNQDCPDVTTGRQNLVAHGTYRTKAGEQRRIILCRSCRRTFTSHHNQGDARYTNEATFHSAMLLLTKGIPIRIVAARVHVNEKTVGSWLHLVAHNDWWYLELLDKIPTINEKELRELLTRTRNHELRQRAAEWVHNARRDPTFTQNINKELRYQTLATRRPRLRSRLHR